MLEAFARKQHLIAVFFDIAKAYDTTWHYHILENIRALDYRGSMGQSIENFPHSRTFTVGDGNKLSRRYTQEQCISQGSVMSGLAINDPFLLMT